MALDEFSYRLGDTGIVLNPDSLVPPFVDITDVRGLDSAPIRITEHDHEGTDGGFVDAEFEKTRPLVLEGMAYGGEDYTLESFLDSLKANWSPGSAPVPFYFKFPGVAERVLFVKPLGCRYNVSTMRRVNAAEVQFLAQAEDPRIYSAELFSREIVQGEVILTGRGYPKGYPYGYGLATTPVGANIFVDGNRPTPPRFSIPGPGNDFQIVNDTLGLTLIFDITLLSGDLLVCDTNTRTVTVNGANRRSALRLPDWFFLQPGDNFLRFRAASSNSTILTVQYRPAWR